MNAILVVGTFCAMNVVLLLWIVYSVLTSRFRKRKITAANFTLEISSLPKDFFDVREIADTMSQLGKVVLVSMPVTSDLNSNNGYLFFYFLFSYLHQLSRN